MSRLYWMRDADYHREQSDAYAEANYSRMQAGPELHGQAIVIPSTLYCPTRTPQAAAEWRRRGFQYDKVRRCWTRTVSSEHAEAQLTKARAVFQSIWHIPGG